MNWFILALVVYIILLVLICLRIVYDTRTNTKALAYILVAIFIPVVGAAFYFLFGINYRKHKLYSKKLTDNKEMLEKIKQQIALPSEKQWHSDITDIRKNKELAHLVSDNNSSPITGKNKVKLLINGDEKFPEVLDALRKARHHIHIEYYIYAADHIGTQIRDILIEKARAGVKVRFIYDDFGSHGLKKNFLKPLQDAGVEVYPFFKVYFWLLANRINYRKHRKIIIIDGSTAFVGGINVSDQYINNAGYPNKFYWRDTHLRIDGPGIFYLQYLFMCDWNYCSDQQLAPESGFFCEDSKEGDDTIIQIAASGPDSDDPVILFSLIQAIGLAEKEVLITSPYFIPGESLLDALNVAALSGISVKLLVPGISDSKFINAAARSYYDDLLQAGVEIYTYQKGFVHAKTMVTDTNISMVGTANMDYRSFELNFEVNALVYDEKFSEALRQVFYNDLKDAVKIDKDAWDRRPIMKQLTEKVARLISPLL